VARRLPVWWFERKISKLSLTASHLLLYFMMGYSFSKSQASCNCMAKGRGLAFVELL
jgi:hypothetical protein